MTPAVISNNHQSSFAGMVVYAVIPLIVMITPGIPQMSAAV